ncbi:molybdopterin biosynthesis protein MoeB [Pseudomonas sp. 58 R 12]|nr:molybdopterin biosynthesis protein MoeB [Pseudomonas sp. 58 R 12]
MTTVSTRSFAQIRQALLDRQEVALVDVREEAPFAESHPLFAANIPLSKLELEVYSRIPRRDTQVTVYDNGEGLAARAAERLIALGYSQVSLLEGGLQGWRKAGGELFIDVNVPSKAFGELVESERHTPSLAAEEVQALLDSQADVVVLDARRFDEYQTMSIPTGISVPGAELVLRARELAPDPTTRIIVNCAGRTRSIIGTQSLINAGVANPVSALRNGTIGWTLAGQKLAHGQSRRFAPTSEEHRQIAAVDARRVADKARVGRATLADLQAWRRTRPARPTCSMFAPRKNSKSVTCRARAPRQAASWFRKPTTSPACAAPAWCWGMTTACARICRRPGWPNWAGKCMCWMTCNRRTSAKKALGSPPYRRRHKPN